MIRFFRHKGLKEFFDNGSKRGIQPQLAARIGDALTCCKRRGTFVTLTRTASIFINLKAKDEMSGRSLLAVIGESRFDLLRETWTT
jgi:plasmid maintenance system killer protein